MVQIFVKRGKLVYLCNKPKQYLQVIKKHIKGLWFYLNHAHFFLLQKQMISLSSVIFVDFCYGWGLKILKGP